MKHKFPLILLAMIALTNLAVGCHDDDSNEPTPSDTTQTKPPVLKPAEGLVQNLTTEAGEAIMLKVVATDGTDITGWSFAWSKGTDTDALTKDDQQATDTYIFAETVAGTYYVAVKATNADKTLTTEAYTFTVTVNEAAPIDSTVYIKWSGTTATVEMADDLSDAITYEINGADVVLTNNNVENEFMFVLSGTSQSGSFTYNGTFKTSFQFDGLNLTSTNGGAIDIQCGKRIKLNLKDGTTNTLADATTGEQKAAFNCQGHMEIDGSGTLSIAGNRRHGLRTKEYLQLKQDVGAIGVAAAADGIHCGEFFLMDGGEITLSGISGDGLQVETDPGSEEVLNGQFIMNGGSINLIMTAEDTKGIRLDIDSLNQTSPVMKILGGSITVDLTSTALGAKAIASDGDLIIGSSTTNPTVDINVAAETFTDPTTSEENRATGIKADKTLTIAGGTTTVIASGKKSRGVRAAKLVAAGGTLTVKNTGSKSQGIKLDGAKTNTDYYQETGGTVNCTNWKY